MTGPLVGSEVATERGRIGMMMTVRRAHGHAGGGVHHVPSSSSSAGVVVASVPAALAGPRPLALLGVEDETGVGQFQGLLGRHGRLLPLPEHAVPVALGVDPISQAGIVLRDAAVAVLVAVRHEVLEPLLPRLGRSARRRVALPGLEDEPELEEVVVPLVGHGGRIADHPAAVRLALGLDETTELGIVHGDLEMAVGVLPRPEHVDPLRPAHVGRSAGSEVEVGILQLHQLRRREEAVLVLLEELVLVPLLADPLGQFVLLGGVDVAVAVLLAEGLVEAVQAVPVGLLGGGEGLGGALAHVLGLALVVLGEGAAGRPVESPRAVAGGRRTVGGKVLVPHPGPADGERRRVPVEVDALEPRDLLLRHGALLAQLVLLVLGALVGHPPPELVGAVALGLLGGRDAVLARRFLGLVLVVVEDARGQRRLGVDGEPPGLLLEGDDALVARLPLLVRFAPLGI
mmetsp:Transcript_21890/g.51707  ORF Transcript_21890/g.51707 Transcript_21890/m.51707 type:complete len:458 (-) Transcript_21890:718-2091(-)